MSLAGFPAARLQIEDTRFPYFPISSIFYFPYDRLFANLQKGYQNQQYI